MKIREKTNSLRLWRMAAAVLLCGGLAAALIDFRELVPTGLGRWLAGVQVAPAGIAAASGAGVSLVFFAGILMITLLVGRVYCSVLCPLGVLQDVLRRLGRLAKGRRRFLTFARPLRWLRQTMLWLSLLACASGWGALAMSWLDPYSHFGRIASGLVRPALTWANNLVTVPLNALGILAVYHVELPMHGLGALLVPALLLSILVVTSVYRGRLYCNSICPVGTLLGQLSRRAMFRLEFDLSACTKCADCLRSCKAQCIDLKRGEIDFDRCVACYNCLSACDEQGIGYRFKWGRGKKAPERSSPALELAALPVQGDGPQDPSRRALLGIGAGALVLAGGLGSRLQAQDKPAPVGKTTGATAGTVSASRRRVAISPPGSGGIGRFLDRCTACHLCISACPKQVLQPAVFEYGLQGFMRPLMDFTAAYCDYDCRKCLEVCPDGAISLMSVADKQLEKIGEVHFHEELCIVKVKGTDCAACSEHCPTKAVHTVPYGDNLRMPEISQDLCIGCGACEFVCPLKDGKAITVSGLAVHQKAIRGLEKDAPAAKSNSDFPF